MEKIKELVEKNELKHIAIIMDGNRRWAKERNLPSAVGHKKGVDALKATMRACDDFGIKYLTVYAFSTENWNRKPEEVNFLMEKALTEFSKLESRLTELDFNVRVIGERDNLDARILKVIDKLNSTPFNEEHFTLFVAFNYSSQLEIINASKEMKKRKLAFTKENFEKCLYTYPAPPIDLLIRTSHEQRLSNFMLYQASYAELYFPSVFWPAFTKRSLYKALEEYQKRDRKFGQIRG